MVEQTASGSASGFAHLDRARSVRIETPEHVRLGFELAGVGSRSAAVILDLLVLVSASSVVFFLATRADFLTSSDLLTSTGAAVGVLLLFVIQWGYFFLCEGLFNGLTPGKRSMGVRVIGAGGTPITLASAALRNLVRIIDVQPAGSSLLGFGMMILHPRSQRLGDVLAGTVVVRDRGDREIPEERAAHGAKERSRLDPKRFDILERYVHRKESLPKEVRTRLAGRVAAAMGPVVALHPERTSMPLEELLQGLYETEAPLQSYSRGTSRQAVQLVREKRAAWARCRDLVAKAEHRGLVALSESELEEFTTLYREVVADLARAHTYGGSLRLCFHLERLAGAAHNLFYRGGGRSSFSLLDWVHSGFPRTFRQQGAYVAVAAVLLFAPAFVVYGGVRADPELGRRFVPPAMVTRAEEAGDRLRAGEQYIDVPQVQMSLFSSRLMTNNLQVAFLAAAGGILAGIGTVLILILNGLSLGAVVGLYDAHEAARLLWLFVFPHGVMELTAIVVSGGAGLLLAHAIVAPGRRTRGRALREEGRTLLSLVGGAGVLLILAGLVEGFVSPAQIPAWLKVSFASTVAALLAAYLGGGRRRSRA